MNYIKRILRSKRCYAQFKITNVHKKLIVLFERERIMEETLPKKQKTSRMKTTYECHVKSSFASLFGVPLDVMKHIVTFLKVAEERDSLEALQGYVLKVS